MRKQLLVTFFLIALMTVPATRSFAIDPESAISFGQNTSQFCEDKLNTELRNFLKNSNSTLLTDFYQLSQMKLTANVLDRGEPSHRTLESVLSRRLQKMNGNTLQYNQMAEQVMRLYHKYGEVKTFDEAKRIVQQMAEGDISNNEKAYRGTDAAVASRLLRELNKDQCNSDQLANLRDIKCMTEKDEAVLWLVGEMNSRSIQLTDNQKRSMDVSNLVAHYSGAAIKDDHSRANQALTIDEIDSRIKEINATIASQMQILEEDFYSRFEQCEQYFGTGECFANKAGDLVPDIIEELTDFFVNDSEMNHLASLDPEGNLTLGAISLYSGVDTAFKEKVEAHQKERRAELAEREGILEDFIGGTIAWEENEVQMCGGNLFKSEMKNIRVFGLNGRVSEEYANSKKMREAYREGGSGAMREKNREANAKSKVGRILNKLHIPGPMFRCSNEPVRAIPTFTFKKADKLVCCENEEKWETMFYGFANFGAGFSCRAFVGVPYIAELGLKVGTGVNLSLGGGSDPAGCKNEVCLQGSLSFNVSGGVYGDVLSGAASAQGTIAWVPFASVRQCGAFQDPRPPARINYKIGHVMFHGSVKVGWFASYEITKVLYSSNKNNEHDIAIF